VASCGQVDKLEEKRRDEEEAKNKAKDRKRQKRLAAENLPMVRGTQSITFIILCTA
jgi:hypothetical protein